jgi:hypothetical protein
MLLDREHVIVHFAMLLALPKVDFHREAEDIQDRWFEVLCQERVQYDNNRTNNA